MVQSRRKRVVVRIADEYITLDIPIGIDYNTFSPEYLERVARVYLSGLVPFPLEEEE